MEQGKLLRRIEKEMPFLPKGWNPADKINFALRYILSNAGDIEETFEDDDDISTQRFEFGVVTEDHTWHTETFDVPDNEVPVVYAKEQLRRKCDGFVAIFGGTTLCENEGED